MKTILPATIACAIIVLSGAVHGVLIGRWEQSRELTEAVLRLKDVPTEIGDWSGEDSTIPDRHLEIGEIDGYLVRRYTNRASGNTVNLLIVCGRPGPISVHTPDVCFQGAGFALTAPVARHEVVDDAGRHLGTVCFGDFRKQSGVLSESIRAYWTWGADNSFVAPENPRLMFAGKPYLYKIYLTGPGGRADEPVDSDPDVELLRLLLPELQATIFSQQ